MGAATGAALREAVTEVRVIDAVTRLMGRSSSACELYAVGTLRVRVSVHIAWALADPAMLVVCTRLLAAAAAAGAGNIPDFLDAGTEVVPCRDGTHSFPRDLVAHCQEKLVRARDTLKRAETAYEDAIRRDEGDQELVGALRVARQEALEVARSIWRGVVGSMCTCSMHRIITRPSKL